MWRININYRWFLGRLSTNLITLLLLQIHIKSDIFLWTKVIWERKKERIHKLFIGLRLWTTSLLINIARPETQDIFMKNGNKGRDVLGNSRKHYCPQWTVSKQLYQTRLHSILRRTVQMQAEAKKAYSSLHTRIKLLKNHAGI